MIKLYIANLGKYNEMEHVGDFIDLPFTDTELQDLFCRIKLGYRDEDGLYHHGYEEDGIYYEEYAIHDFETDLNIEIGEYSSIYRLNDIAEGTDRLNDTDINVLNAIIDSTSVDIEKAIEILNAKDYTIIDNVKNVNDFGYALVQEGYFGVDIPSGLEDYVNYKEIGQDWLDDNWTLCDNFAISVNY